MLEKTSIQICRRFAIKYIGHKKSKLKTGMLNDTVFEFAHNVSKAV